MSSGRLDSQRIVYLAGKKARERGRDKNVSDTWRYDKLEALRTKMAECQVEYLASPEDCPSLLNGKEEEWNKRKIEYDKLMRAGAPENSSDRNRNTSSQNRPEHISNAAVRAVKDHIHNAITYAGSLSKESK